MLKRFYFLCLLIAVVMILPQQAFADTAPPKIGTVVMHGKGGGPNRLVKELAGYLEANGCLVANLEMPWSGKRKYDVGVEDAVKEVKSALDTMQKQGAQKLFVIGHSQGGLFTFYFGGRHRVDGLVTIAPGGSVASQVFKEKLFEPLERARAMVAAGKGNEKAGFFDYENSKGLFDVNTTAAVYLEWFDADGAMNLTKAVQSVIPGVPILYIVPVSDYPGLIKAKGQVLENMPKNPGNRLYEPDATHMSVPTVAKEEILRWMKEIAATK